jgi:hypothetical protein
MWILQRCGPYLLADPDGLRRGLASLVEQRRSLSGRELRREGEIRHQLLPWGLEEVPSVEVAFAILGP